MNHSNTVDDVVPSLLQQQQQLELEFGNHTHRVSSRQQCINDPSDTNSVSLPLRSDDSSSHNNTDHYYRQYQPYNIRYTSEQEQIYFPTTTTVTHTTSSTSSAGSSNGSHNMTLSDETLFAFQKSTDAYNHTNSTSCPTIPTTTTTANTTSTTATTSTTTMDVSHLQPMGTWSKQQIYNKRQQHSFACTWQSNFIRHSLPHITHGDGIYLYAAAAVQDDDDDDDTEVVGSTASYDDDDDARHRTETDNGSTSSRKNEELKNIRRCRRYIDWTSQAVCANLGHSVPQQILDATMLQMQTVPYIYSGLGMTEIKIRITALLNECILPPPLVVAVFPNSGAEANEAGIVLARRYTKRNKVISMYRSYHGATPVASSITGDYRRWYNEPLYNDHHFTSSSSSNNFIKAFHPFPLFFQHSGTTPSEQVISALHMIEEQIIHEGPYNIASIVMESIIGAGGCCIYPTQYIHGIRAICNKYGILLHFDEIMVGFGRTGTMFGFQNYSTVVPDIVTVAKGLTSAYIPLSMMACKKDILDYFETTPLGWGSTYESHPVALATAYETIKFMLQNNTLHHVQTVSVTFRAEMERLATLHLCIKQYRAIGLFGCFDIHDSDGCHPKLPYESFSGRLTHSDTIMAYEKYVQAYADNGLIGLHRFPHIHCAPPLIITIDELYDGFQRLHKALLVLDDALGFNQKN